MTPAVPFFSVFRTSQSKYKGMFINPENESVLGYVDGVGTDGRANYETLQSHELYRDVQKFNLGQPVHFRKYDTISKTIQEMGGEIANHPLSNPNKPFQPYAQHKGILNSIGEAQSNFRRGANIASNEILKENSFSNRTMSHYWNAAFAYTPYMWAKRESAILWDNGKTDVAVERLIDGVADLNFKEAKEGTKELWKAVWHQPFDDPEREKIAKKRVLVDTSTPDGMTKENAQALKKDTRYNDYGLSWQERIIQAAQKPKENKDYLKSKPIEKRPDKYSDTEMAALLATLKPPSNSIH
jgi:uncharacterized membrane protein YqiK